MFDTNNDDLDPDDSKPPMTLQFLKHFDGKYYVSYEDMLKLLNSRLESLEDSFNDNEKDSYKDIKESIEHCYQTIKGDEYIKEIEADEIIKRNQLSYKKLKEDISSGWIDLKLGNTVIGSDGITTYTSNEIGFYNNNYWYEYTLFQDVGTEYPNNNVKDSNLEIIPEEEDDNNKNVL
jgi:hypothetical protein